MLAFVLIGTFLFALSSTAIAESNHCNEVEKEIICEISIISNKYPLQDYSPDIAEVPKDAKVIFKNEGFIVHTATSTDASPEDNTYLATKYINGIFDTGKLLAGETAESITMKDEGIFHYFCTIHQGMRGTIVVIDPNPDEKTEFEEHNEIPNWIRNNAEWWSQELISDADFVSGIEFMIENNIIVIPQNIQSEKISSNTIPDWIRGTSEWWARGLISDSEFAVGIQYLINNGIISLSQMPTHVSTQMLQSIPASSGSVINFYVNDHDLNTSPNGIDVILTEGLIVATINGHSIDIPPEMVETSQNSGKFFFMIEIPQIVNGKPLSQDDIVLVEYLDESDSTGNQKFITNSIPLSKTFAKLESDDNKRIGHKFILSIHEPDANRDSKDEDRILLDALEFRAEGGIRTTLANSAFDANSSFLIETGPSTNIFEVEIKIPRVIDGETMHIGDWFEIRYIDNSTPSNTMEKIVIKGKIG